MTSNPMLLAFIASTIAMAGGVTLVTAGKQADRVTWDLTLATLLGVPMLACGVLSTATMPGALATFVAASLVGLSALFLLDARARLDGKEIHLGAFWGSWGALKAGLLAAVCLGASNPATFAVPVAMLAASLAALGWRQVVKPGQVKQPAWLGVPVLLLAVAVPASTWLVREVGQTGYMLPSLLAVWLQVAVLAEVMQRRLGESQRENELLRHTHSQTAAFAATMGHELRTPLAAVRTGLTMLNGSSEEERAVVVRMVKGNVVQLDRMLSELMDFGKLEAKLFSYNYEAWDLGDVMMRVRDSYNEIVKEHKLTFTAEIPDEEIPVSIDADRIVQVVSNLLNNAIKFTGDGGRVSLRVYAQGGSAFMEVTDTGVGMRPADVARLFTRFFQVDDGSGYRQGCGLGLWIAKALVEDGHKGRLGVRSVYGEGSTFTVELPLVESDVRAGNVAWVTTSV